jgi:hypothetical protein
MSGLDGKYIVLCEKLENEAKPCPFCKSANIYVGPSDSIGYVVRCRKCRASGPRIELPDRWPAGIKKKSTNTNSALAALQVMLTNKAFKAWQRRA